MSSRDPVLPNDAKQRLQKAMNTRASNLSVFLRQLKEEGVTNHDYKVPFVRWEDCSRYMNSCWGSEIADVRAYVFYDGTFQAKTSDGSGTAPITDNLLVQRLKRCKSSYTTTAPEGVRLGLGFNGGTPGMEAVHLLSPVRECHVVNTTEGVLVFGLGRGGEATVYKAHQEDKWVHHDGTVVPINVQEACEATADATAPRPIADGPPNSYVLPQKESPFVALFGFRGQGSLEYLSKIKVCTYQPVDELTETEETAERAPGARDDFDFSSLDDAVRKVASSSSVWEAFRSPEGRMCAAVAVGADDFRVLNALSGGKALEASYDGGYEVPLFSVRHENMNETVIKVPLRKLKVVATDPDGANPKMVQLYEMMKHAGAFGKHAGVNEGVDLTDSSNDDESVTLRIQAYLTPGDKGTEVYEKVYSYQTHDDTQPTCLYTYHTAFGTTWLTSTSQPCKVQPSVLNKETGENAAFNLSIEPSKKRARDAATYTQADNEASVKKGRSMAVPLGPLGFPKLANSTMFVQFPVSVPPDPRRATSGFSFGDEPPKYRSLGAADGEEEGQLVAATTGLGSYQGKSSGVKNGALTRRKNASPTITFSIFFSIVPKEGADSGPLLPGELQVSKEDVAEVVRQMDELHAIAGEAKKLFDPEAELCTSLAECKAVMSKEPVDDPSKSGLVAAPQMTMVAM